MVQTQVQPLFALTHDIDDAAEHGEVFTRPWVVGLILDLVGYEPERDLAALRLVEPACGSGSFLEVIAERVSQSCRIHDRELSEAVRCVLAYDLLPRHVEAARERIASTFVRNGWRSDVAREVAVSWVRVGDFLLDHAAREMPADIVVGNPPYVRLESVSEARMAAYRRACVTMVGRADLYVGFFEVALSSLRDNGVLGFICADRWMRNQYGRVLRRLVSGEYAVDVVIGMHEVDAFEEVVSAYPAITIIRKGRQRTAAVVDTSSGFDRQGADDLLSWIRQGSEQATSGPGFSASRLPHWFTGDESWPSGSPARLRVLEDLADRFIALGDPASGVRVGIGVATGADQVFITIDPSVVEPERLLPLSMVRDTASGRLRWSGSYLVNPWDEHGVLVKLGDFPRFAAYLEEHEETLRARHVGRRQPAHWYRTIDKVDPGLAAKEKLLFPDMKSTSEPVLDKGGYYPHHNLYFVTSDRWDLRVLGGLLMSAVAEAFIDAYAVKMRGGALRFQAQYLRRIRVPHPAAIPARLQSVLMEAFERRDRAAATEAALEVYSIDCLPA